MNLARLRTTGVLVACLVAVGATSGCISVNSPNTPSVTVAPPTALPTIPVDTSKSFDEQVNEIKRAYCKVRNTPAADAVADAGKRIWNEIANAARGQNVAVPEFNPDDPQMCEGV